MLFARIGFVLAFGAAGLYLLRAALLVLKQRGRWKTEGVVTEGTIVGFKTESFSGDRAGRAFELPIVKFKIIDGGAPMQFTSERGERPNPYVVGQKINVRYLRTDPNIAELDSVSQSWFTFIALAFAGLVALVVATLPIILRR